VDDLNSTQGIVALAAAGLGLVAFVWVVVLSLKLRRVRAAQRSDWVEEVASGLEGRVSGAERRMDGCISHTSVIRYDAMNELSGQQSSTVALLDERQTGVVISSILHRDQARLYVKRVQDGNPEYELSPEEQQAVDAAMAGTPA